LRDLVAFENENQKTSLADFSNDSLVAEDAVSELLGTLSAQRSGVFQSGNQREHRQRFS